MTQLRDYKRIVVKIGSALLVKGGSLRRPWLTRLCNDVADMRTSGVDVVIVSSGAVALGCTVLGLDRKGLSLAEKQACAAVGQSRLTRAYDDALAAFGLKSAQALLTVDDTENRRRWLNARATLQTLLKLGIVPVVNENDTVATEEIRYGDNDRLSARTAQMIGADLLILLSDIDGLYSADPRHDTTATHIPKVDQITPNILAMAGDANSEASVGSGGMITKLQAAQIATQAGCDMIICNGERDNPLASLANGSTHTKFIAATDPKGARAQWIGGSLSVKGRVTIDAGASKAVRGGKSLLAAGLISVRGQFDKGDAVSVLSESGAEIARGLSSYDSSDLTSVMGLRSEAIKHPAGAVIIHSDNLVTL